MNYSVAITLAKHKRTLVYISIFAFAFVCYCLLFTPYSISFLDNLGVLYREPSVTELYFKNYGELPTDIKNNDLQSFIFTIKNNSNDKKSYTFVAEAIQNKTTMQISTGNITLFPNTKKDFKIPIPNLEPSIRTKISVKLINSDHAISFWMRPATTTSP